MSDEEVDRLREHAESLLAMALKAREEGQFEQADRLIAEAARLSNEADDLEVQSRREQRSQAIYEMDGGASKSANPEKKK